MKRILSFILLLFLLTGCTPMPETMPRETPTQMPTPASTPTIMPEKSVPFTAYYSRTDGYHDDVVYPFAVVIRSAEELESYYRDAAPEYGFDYLFDEGINNAMRFSDSLTRYDNAYFADNALILAVFEEPSGSIRHEVTDVTLDADRLTVCIDRLLPQEGTSDMAEWHIVIELSTDDATDAAVIELSDRKVGYYNVMISSDGMLTNMHVRQVSSAKYDEETDEMVYTQTPSLEEQIIAEYLGEIEWHEDFTFVLPPHCTIGDFHIYSEDAQTYRQSDTLDISMLNAPATYPIRFVGTWTFDDNPITYQPDVIVAEHFFRLVIDEDDLQ